MRVKAKVTFGGQYAMREGETGSLPDNPVTRALIENGFLEEAEEQPKEPEERKSQPLEKPEKPAGPDLRRLRKDDLVKICRKKGIKVDKKATKEELIAAIEAQE